MTEMYASLLFDTMQDRISKDGSLIAGILPGKQEHATQQQSQARPATLPATAPILPPIAEEQLQRLVDTIADSRHGSELHIDLPQSLGASSGSMIRARDLLSSNAMKKSATLPATASCSAAHCTEAISAASGHHRRQ